MCASRDVVLMAHPSPDRYGSDLQLLETVSAVVDAGADAVVVLPADGPLAPMLRERGASVRILAFPVLRKSALRPAGFARLLRDLAIALPPMWRTIGDSGATTVLVNTVTIPWWLAVSRLRRRRTWCHVHEAEDEGPRIVRTLLAAPNLLAQRLLVNSGASAQALYRVVPALRHRIDVVHNGVGGPPQEPDPPRTRTPADPARLVVVARLSPRKGIDVALDAVGEVIDRGHDVTVDLCGTTFSGYEWFEQRLRDRAARPDLAGRVTFRGYVNPTWPELAAADVVLVPSRVEPFGNTAVEALLARRPLVASNVQGLAEIVAAGQTGLLAVPGDATSLADAICRLLDDPSFAAELADRGRADATERFSLAGYRAAIARSLLETP